MLANAKRMESKVDGSFRVPKDRVASIASSMDEGEETPLSEVENAATSTTLRSNRRYRESASNDSFGKRCLLLSCVFVSFDLFVCSLAFLPTFSASVVTEEGSAVEAPSRHHSDWHMKVCLLVMFLPIHLTWNLEGR